MRRSSSLNRLIDFSGLHQSSSSSDEESWKVKFGRSSFKKTICQIHTVNNRGRQITRHSWCPPLRKRSVAPPPSSLLTSLEETLRVQYQTFLSFLSESVSVGESAPMFSRLLLLFISLLLLLLNVFLSGGARSPRASAIVVFTVLSLAACS